MKYKNRLIVPTLITTSLLTSGLVAHADEVTDETSDIEEIEIIVSQETKHEITDSDIDEVSHQETDALETYSDSTEETIHNEKNIAEEPVNEPNSEDIQEEDIITETEELITVDDNPNIDTPETNNTELEKSDSEEQLLENETFQKTTEEQINHESIDQASELISEEENIEHTKSETNENSLPKESYEQSNQVISSDTITTNDVEVLEESEIEKDILSTPKNHENKVRTLSAPAQIASFSTK